MSEHNGPWPPRSEPPPPTRRALHLGLWIGLIAAVGAGVWALSRLLPGAVSSSDDWSNVAYGLGMTAVVSAWLLRTRHLNLRRTAQYAAIWIGVLAMLGLGYSYRGELGGVWTRLRSAVAPGMAASTAPGEMVVTQDDQGNFTLLGQVNGQPVRFVVDTGASDIVLTPADARRLGVDVDHLSYPHPTETANGVGRSAPYTARSLVIGGLALANVDMAIDAAPMSTSLLGMSFLRRLESYQVRDGRLYLRWRG